MTGIPTHKAVQQSDFGIFAKGSYEKSVIYWK